MNQVCILLKQKDTCLKGHCSLNGVFKQLIFIDKIVLESRDVLKILMLTVANKEFAGELE